MGALYLMVEVEMVTCPHNSPLDIEGEAIDIDHRVTKQQYTTLLPLNGLWVVERPVVWHVNKKTQLCWILIRRRKIYRPTDC